MSIPVPMIVGAIVSTVASTVISKVVKGPVGKILGAVVGMAAGGWASSAFAAGGGAAASTAAQAGTAAAKGVTEAATKTGGFWDSMGNMLDGFGKTLSGGIESLGDTVSGLFDGSFGSLSPGQGIKAGAGLDALSVAEGGTGLALAPTQSTGVNAAWATGSANDMTNMTDAGSMKPPGQTQAEYASSLPGSESNMDNLANTGLLNKSATGTTGGSGSGIGHGGGSGGVDGAASSKFGAGLESAVADGIKVTPDKATLDTAAQHGKSAGAPAQTPAEPKGWLERNPTLAMMGGQALIGGASAYMSAKESAKQAEEERKAREEEAARKAASHSGAASGYGISSNYMTPASYQQGFLSRNPNTYPGQPAYSPRVYQPPRVVKV